MTNGKGLNRPGFVGRERAAQMRARILGALDEAQYRDVSPLLTQEFGVSRQVIHKQFRRLEAQELIVGRGKTKAREHRLAITKYREGRAVQGLQEYDFWREFAEPHLAGVPE